MIIAILVLLALAAFLALAETGLTRMSRAKALGARGVGPAQRGRRSARLVTRPEEFINPLLLVVLIIQTVQTALTTLVAERLFGGAGVAIGLFVNVVLVFVLCEAAPKTWAVQHPDKAALATAAPGARAHPVLAAADDLARPHRAHQRDPPGQGPEAGAVRVRGGAARGGRRGRTSPRRSTTPSARSSRRSSSSATRSSAR